MSSLVRHATIVRHGRFVLERDFAGVLHGPAFACRQRAAKLVIAPNLLFLAVSSPTLASMAVIVADALFEALMATVPALSEASPPPIGAVETMRGAKAEAPLGRRRDALAAGVRMRAVTGAIDLGSGYPALALHRHRERSALELDGDGARCVASTAKTAAPPESRHENAKAANGSAVADFDAAGGNARLSRLISRIAKIAQQAAWRNFSA